LTFDQEHSRDSAVPVVLWVLAGMLEAVRTGQAEAHQIDQAEVHDHIGQAGDLEELQIGRHAVVDGTVLGEVAARRSLVEVDRTLAELRSLLLEIQKLSIQ
jgi:hypothetical protein